MSYEIIRNDITKVKADAIVNTANPRPLIGSGTDKAIHLAAGPELLAARKQIGEIEVGSVGVTPAFQLDAKIVIHAVSPAWCGGRQNEEALLRSAYDKALQAAVDNHCSSIAFPLLAAGNYGFPKEKAMSIALSAFTDFLMTHEIQIILVVFNKSVFQLAGHLFDDLRSFVDENYVRDAYSTEYEMLDSGFLSRYEELRYLRNRRDELRRPEPPQASYGVGAGLPSDALSDADMGMSLDDLIKKTDTSFHEALFKLIDASGKKDSEIYTRADVLKQQFSKIRSTPDYQPTKSLAIRLALALELDYNATQEFLGYAGYTLSRSSVTDVVVEYYIRKKQYDLNEINTALYGYNLPLLSNNKSAS